jgi:hypothetical protein
MKDSLVGEVTIVMEFRIIVPSRAISCPINKVLG